LNIVVQPLIDTFETADNNLRANISAALNKIGASTLKPLAIAAKNPNKKIRFGAIYALGFIEVNRPIYKDKETGSITAEYREVEPLASLGGDEILSLILEALKDNDEQVRSQATETLHNMEEVSLIEPLLLLLNDNEKWVRYNAVRTLGRMKDIRAFDHIASLIRDSDDNVCDLTIDVLVDLDQDRAVPLLIEALNDEQPHVKRRVTYMLERLEEKS
jgi:HEAT repeat protein